jgi:hypothetical protein
MFACYVVYHESNVALILVVIKVGEYLMQTSASTETGTTDQDTPEKAPFDPRPRTGERFELDPEREEERAKNLRARKQSWLHNI